MFRVALPIIAAVCVMSAAAATAPDLTGVYQAIPNDKTLEGGRKNQGSPAEIPLLPAAAQQLQDPKEDPAKKCVPVGPFRMMARDQVKIELVPVTGMIVMLFEDLSHGTMRTIHMDRDHLPKMDPLWFGDSVGKWEGDSLVVDTTGFNDRTWFNERGAQHSDALHLVERIRPVLSGKALEYKVTAEDPKVLAKPYTYTRYFEKVTTEIADNACQDEE
jgi:hypothetical protein